MTSHRSPSQHSGGWALGSRPTFFLVGHAALLRGPITAPQSAGHSAPRFGHASSIGSQVPTSFRTAVRLPTNDLSCTLFVPAPPCSLTHCPNLASPRSSSSASTSLGGQLGCLCTACMVCFASRPALQFQAQLRALQAFAQISPQPFPRTALHGPAQHGNMAGASTALQAFAARPARRPHPGLQKPRSTTHSTARVGAGRGKDDVVRSLARSCRCPQTQHRTAPAARQPSNKHSRPRLRSPHRRRQRPPRHARLRRPALQRRRPDPTEIPPRPAAIRHRPAALANGGASAAWADADEDEWDELGHAEAASSTAPRTALEGQRKGQSRVGAHARPRLGPARPALRTMGWPRATARHCGATHRPRHRTPSPAPHRAASRCPRSCAPKCVG